MFRAFFCFRASVSVSGKFVHDEFFPTAIHEGFGTTELYDSNLSGVSVTSRTTPHHTSNHVRRQLFGGGQGTGCLPAAQTAQDYNGALPDPFGRRHRVRVDKCSQASRTANRAAAEAEGARAAGQLAARAKGQIRILQILLLTDPFHAARDETRVVIPSA